jgi:hypothetical protein
LPRLTIDLAVIKSIAAEREDENDAFRIFIKNSDSHDVDRMVHSLNDAITPQIDCTQCGNCCKSLMINITAPEANKLAAHLNMDLDVVKEKYIEESLQGQMIMNTIPCHFLSGTKCSIYEHRFNECREFPHLHKDNFSDRLFGMLIHYASCPIIFNVVEALKITTGFTDTDDISTQ